MKNSLGQRLYRAVPRSLKRRVAAVLPGSKLPARVQGLLDSMAGGVAIVAYPKCGRTWLRLMIGRALSQHFELTDVDPFDLDTMAERDRRVPRIQISSDGSAEPRTPAELPRSKKRYRSKHVILLVRDPRDVVVSWFFQLTKRARGSAAVLGDLVVPDDLASFLRWDRWSLQTIVAFYNNWHSQTDVPADRVCLVRYEDLRRAPEVELRRIFVFMGLGNVSEAAVQEAVDYARFDNMKKLESVGGFSSRALQPGDTADPESFKVRRGVVGGYRDYFDAADIEYLDGYIAANLAPGYGY